MVSGKRLQPNSVRHLILALAVLLSNPAQAEPFVPYPGKREVTVARVEEPDLVFVTFNTDATGFFRTVGIRMPGIVVAKDTPQADQCEREAAARALGFVESFLAEAKTLHVQDMRMENSADDEAVSPILTDKGSLSAAMIKEGIARSDSVDPTMPWCQ
jgi:endonuclease YncB( thermonuclease family)